MAKRKRRSVQPKELKLFRDLKGYVESVTQVELRKGRFYSICVRASFAKCYEFNVYAWDNNNSASLIFSIPTLRGICEDLIVLNCVQGIGHAERDSLVAYLMAHDMQFRLRTQEAFFKKNRPQQPVLPPWMSPTQIGRLEDRIRDVWRANGWPNMKRGVIPPTRQMAEKRGGDILTTLYDYLYRLTSGTVHFNVSELFRMGWGDLPRFTFSPTNLRRYYTMYGRIYGAFMFCCYFELFARIIRSDDELIR